MAHITKDLGIAISDSDAGRISREQLLSIFQEAIDNGDILEEENELAVVAYMFPLIDSGLLRRSTHVDEFASRMNGMAANAVRELKEQDKRHWWRFWR